MPLSTEDNKYLHDINNALILIGMRSDKRLSEESFEGLLAAYRQKSRFYHIDDHGKSMALEHSGISRTESGEESDTLLYWLKDPRNREYYYALKVIIGAFHDAVYYAVDGFKVAPVAEETMNRYFVDFAQGKKELTLKTDVDGDHKDILEMALTLFGFDEGRTFDTSNAKQSKGFNEFASALLIADKMLELGIDKKEIAIVIMGTAATVPFEPLVNGDHMDTLKSRMDTVSTKQGLYFSREEVQRAAILATDIANQDVLGFAGNRAKDRLERARNYLKGSWRMIAELNPSLRDDKNTTKEYFDGLKNMAWFTNAWLDPKNVAILNPDTIFHTVQLTDEKGAKTQFPAKHEYDELEKYRDEVLSDAGLYMDMKVVSAGILLALNKDADIGDAMAALNGASKVIHLPSGPIEETAPEQEKIVYALLRGRGKDPLIPFDVDRSPIGEFLFARLPEANRAASVKALKVATLSLREGSITPEEYFPIVEDAIGGENFRMLKGALQSSLESGLRATREKAIETPAPSPA